MGFRCLFHLHTRHSFDSILSPAKILARAREMRVHVLIVTDHNTIQGSRSVHALSAGTPPMMIMAAEYQSEKGDIIGLFLKEEIRTRNSQEIIQQIHEQDGLVVLPHPYKAHKLDDELLAGVDLIESHNSRCSGAENARAGELARKLNRPVIGGADAHCLCELGAVLNEFSADVPKDATELRKCLLHAPRHILTERVSPLCLPYSQMVKAVKTKDPILFLSQAKRVASFLARNAIGESKT